MTTQHSPAGTGIQTISLAQLIARRAIPVGCALGLAISAPALAVNAPRDAKLGDEFRVNTTTAGPQRSPEVARNANGDFVVVWESGPADFSDTDIFAQRYAADGSKVGNQFRVNTTTAGLQHDPRVAMDAEGDFVVVWDGYKPNGDDNGVSGQRYMADGSPLGSELRANFTTTGNQVNPAVAMDADGDFVVVWQSEGQDGDGYGIYGTRYGANLSSGSANFKVNTFTSGNQVNPAVAMDADGDFVVAWTSYGQDGDNSGVFAQSYTAAGDLAGDEFRVNTITAGIQRAPAVAMDAAGDFVVTWDSYGQDGSVSSVYGQRYAPSGTGATCVPVGQEFPVNTLTTGRQRDSEVSMDADGDFVVAWESYAGNDSNGEVFARRFAADDGSPAGDEFQVNTETTDAQRRPGIALDADGDFVVAWESYGQDGDEFGIYAQRFVGPEDVDLAVTITDSPDPVTVGNTLTYTLTLDNNHPVVAPTGVAAIDNAIGSAAGVTGSAQLTGPAFTLLGFDIPQGSGVTCVPGTAANSVVCTGEDPLVAGASLSVGVRVQPNASGMLVGTANAAGNQFDSNEGESNDNNTDTEQTTVNAADTGGGDTGGDTGGTPGPIRRITSVGASGGCSMSAVPGKPDPTLPVLGLLAGLVLVLRRRTRAWSNRIWPVV